jgi:hypothetical protein
VSDYDHSIHSNPDARAWAAFFMETWEKIGRPAPDVEWMTGWFANAMMAMYDAGPLRTPSSSTAPRADRSPLRFCPGGPGHRSGVSALVETRDCPLCCAEAAPAPRQPSEPGCECPKSPADPLCVHERISARQPSDPFGMGLPPSALTSHVLTATEVQKRHDEATARQPSVSVQAAQLGIRSPLTVAPARQPSEPVAIAPVECRAGIGYWQAARQPSDTDTAPCTCWWPADFKDHGQAVLGPHHSETCPRFREGPSSPSSPSSTTPKEK